MELADWIQAGATVVLVAVTWLYVRQVRRQADQAAEAARQAERSARAMERMAELVAPEVHAQRAQRLQWIRDTARELRERVEVLTAVELREAAQDGRLRRHFVGPDRLRPSGKQQDILAAACRTRPAKSSSSSRK